MRLQKKSISKVTLADLLRRKRTDLQSFLAGSGIVSYELLVSRCNSMGVVPPTDEEFQVARGFSHMHDISSPAEGIVVLQPPPEDSVLSSKNSENDDVKEETPQTDGELELTQTAQTQTTQKKKKKKDETILV